MKNNNYYPEPFFTKSYIPNNNQVYKENYNSGLFGGNSMLGSLLNNINIEQIKNLLPLLLHKKDSAGFNFAELIKNFSPDAEKLFSTISSLGLGNKKNTNKEKQSQKQDTNDSVIDISEYEETS
ncbi:MAG: hypothetical protein J6T74_05210 [Clostridia bacterium]|nr:hypothetical protein [Clostridia bacterium]